jgi:phage-related protein (TIGR01555 family)
MSTEVVIDNPTELPKGVKRQYPAPSWIYQEAANKWEVASNGGRARDYFSNPASRLGLNTPSLAESTQYQMVRLSYDYWLLEILYRNHWIAGQIVDIPVDDMVKSWPRLSSDIAPEDLTKIDQVIRDTQTKPKISMAMKWGRLFGGAGALIVIDGHEDKLDKPLDIDDVGLGSYRGLIPFDRWVGVQPTAEVSSDITNPLGFNLPEFYTVQSPTGGQSFRVHASRLLRFVGPEVPTPEYQAQQYWGISVLERVYEELRKRDNMSWNILGLTYRAQLIGINFDQLAQALSGAGMSQPALQAFYQRMEAFNQVMSNQSLIMLPKDGQMHTTNYSFTGTADVYAQFQMDIAGAAQIPVTRLFGRTITGLGQSNDSDERIYEQRIAMYQDSSLRPQLDRLYRVITMSELGRVPDDLDLIFPSVRVLDEKEKSDLAKSYGDTTLGYFGAGIFDEVTALREIKQNSVVTGYGTNVTDELIAKAEKRQKEADKLGLNLLPPGMSNPAEEEDENEEDKDEKPAKTAKKKPTPISKGKKKAADAAPVSHEIFAGIPINVEYEQGTRRTIRNDKGIVVYDRIMNFPYGEIPGTISDDGDPIDVILGPDEDSEVVYSIWMIDLGSDLAQRQNEPKVCIGFPSEAEAIEAFEGMYGPEWNGGVERVSIDQYRKQVAA